MQIFVKKKLQKKSLYLYILLIIREKGRNKKNNKNWRLKRRVEARRWNRREQYKTKGTRGRVKAMREGEGEGDAGGAGGVEARALCQIYYCYAGSSEADVFICETGYGRVGF